MGAAMKANVLRMHELDPGFVLTPLRYERDLAITDGTPLRDIAVLARQTISPAKAATFDRIVILDTTHARNGLLDCEQALAANAKVGGSKKIIEVGDVVISRLRPYLRQVAFVDEGAAPGLPICGSTEFYVIRSLDGQSISFLVPWLLSDRVQQLLANSQEGGHHPRFNDEVLMRLMVPAAVMARRAELSETVEHASKAYRQCRSLLKSAADLVAG